MIHIYVLPVISLKQKKPHSSENGQVRGNNAMFKEKRERPGELQEMWVAQDFCTAQHFFNMMQLIKAVL